MNISMKIDLRLCVFRVIAKQRLILTVGQYFRFSVRVCVQIFKGVLMVNNASQECMGERDCAYDIGCMCGCVCLSSLKDSL